MQDFKKRSIETSPGRRIGKTYQTPRGITARPNRRKFTSKTSRSNLKLCLRLLRACRQRLKSDSAWTKFAFGRDVNGKTTHSTDPRAMRWCLVGTLKRTQRDLKLSYRHVVFCQNLLLFFINTERSKSVICFNDTRTTTHKDVLSLLTLCISALELRLKRRKDRSPVEYIQRGRGCLEKIVSNRQQKKEHPPL